MDKQEFTVSEIVDQSNGVIKDCFIQNLKIIDYAIHYICDYDESKNIFRLNYKKVVKSIALAMM